MALPLPPTYFYPRCVVRLSVLLDDHVPGIPTPVQLLKNYAQFTAIPRSVEVQRNSSRKADTASVTLDYRDFPLDPRLIRDITVSIHLESVLDPELPLVPTPLNLRFYGRVDVPRVSLSSSGQTVRLECRDFTGIWLDKKWPGKNAATGLYTNPCPVGTTLQMMVEAMRLQVTPNTLPAVFLNSAGLPDPSIAATDMHRLIGRDFFVSKEDDNAWGVLSAICDKLGLVPCWNLGTLEIRSPTLSSVRNAVMVYGQNVERLEFERDLRQNQGKQVVIRCYNEVLGQVLTAIWPLPVSPDYSLVARLNPGPTEGSEKPKTTIEQVQYSVTGPYDPATLQVLARRVWTEMRQNQLAGELETRDMTDLIGFDLLPLANGDRLTCQLGTEDQAAISHMSPAEAIAFLSDPTRPNFLSPAAAEALVSAWTVAQSLNITFYVLEAHHSWDCDDGYRLRVRFRDFVLGV